MESSKEIIIHARERDVGGLLVHRSLPYMKKRNVGPFVFLDHMGPLLLDKTHALDVKPHPHIGLATVTYLFEGRIFHRDSIGSKQEITPGALNLMIAGKGIVHSERTPVEDRDQIPARATHGIQIWVALPKDLEESEPSFTHWPKESFPTLSPTNNLSANILLGEHNGKKSPVPTLWKTLFMDCQNTTDFDCELSFTEQEIAISVVAGELNVNSHRIQENDLIIVDDPRTVKIKTSTASRFVIIGGDPYPEPRHIWWNFVSSSKERIRKAANDWKNQTMGQVEGEHEFIPLPSDLLP